MHKHHQSPPPQIKEACACPVFISIKDVCVVVICLASSENREKKSKQILLFHCKDDEVLSPLTDLGKGSVSEGLAGGCASVLSEKRGCYTKGLHQSISRGSRVSAAICIGESWHSNIRGTGTHQYRSILREES